MLTTPHMHTHTLARTERRGTTEARQELMNKPLPKGRLVHARGCAAAWVVAAAVAESLAAVHIVAAFRFAESGTVDLNDFQQH